nr:zinc finger, CCHC-type [Tanacetum cinerariifolium]
MVKRMASMNTRLNIEKINGNIVQKHRGSKQVGLKQLSSKQVGFKQLGVKQVEFKQLDPGVETGVHEVHNEKHVWFEVELKGARAQRDREAKFFQVSNDDTTVAQRRLEHKQLEEKTNTDYLVKNQEKEYQTGWKIKTGNVLDFCNQRSTYLMNRSPSLAIGFKDPIDMLGFFGWLASIKQEMLEPVKVKCIFLGYHKNIVGNKLWRLDDITLKVVLYKNMGFNESKEYKKTFIGYGVGTGSMQVLHRFEFEVELLEDHTFEVKPQENVNQGAGLKELQTQDLMDYQLARDREHLACELFGYREDSNKDAFAVAAKIWMFDQMCMCSAMVAGKVVMTATTITKSMHQGLLDKAKGNVPGMEIVRDQSGNTLRVSQFRFYNEKLVQTMLEGHSILSLDGSLLGDCDVEKNGKWSCIYVDGSQKYQMVCTRLDIASTDVGLEEGNMAKGTLDRVEIRAKEALIVPYCLAMEMHSVF